eukprot:TRINITY_DN315_c0_g1_i5.p1 TRINITY_DN315_c0_g1~~TRINITY_DN315_c0_g1_i5.p1  ORF type:complete len:316 (-),score=138.55 TRINITY_DN315_c0_g1_i5:105-1022(-)
MGEKNMLGRVIASRLSAVRSFSCVTKRVQELKAVSQLVLPEAFRLNPTQAAAAAKRANSLPQPLRADESLKELVEFASSDVEPQNPRLKSAISNIQAANTNCGVQVRLWDRFLASVLPWGSFAGVNHTGLWAGLKNYPLVTIGIASAIPSCAIDWALSTVGINFVAAVPHLSLWGASIQWGLVLALAPFFSSNSTGLFTSLASSYRLWFNKGAWTNFSSSHAQGLGSFDRLLGGLLLSWLFVTLLVAPLFESEQRNNALSPEQLQEKKKNAAWPFYVAAKAVAASLLVSGTIGPMAGTAKVLLKH